VNPSSTPSSSVALWPIVKRLTYETLVCEIPHDAERTVFLYRQPLHESATARRCCWRA